MEVKFDEPVERGGQVYAFRFDTKLFLQSTVFSARLQSDLRPDLEQEVVSGDATNMVATQSLSVVSRLKNNALLEEVVVDPSILTPNDDGINDFPDFNVRNYRYDLRMDWEPNSDLTVSLSHGYAWAKLNGHRQTRELLQTELRSAQPHDQATGLQPPKS